MKKRLFLITILTTYSINVLAQNFKWAKSFGGTDLDRSFSIAIDHDGNVLNTGDFSTTSDFDPDSTVSFNLTSAGKKDIFISKVDANGKFLWAKSIGGKEIETGKCITTDINNNIYVTGIFTDTIDFDPGKGTYNLISKGNADVFILKLNKYGNFIWAVNIGGSASETGEAIISDDFGNIYIAGGFLNTVDFDPGSKTFNLTSFGNGDVFVAKFDTTGNFIWAKQLGGKAGEEVRSMTIDASNNIYIIGHFQATADFDPGTNNYNLTSNGGLDIFISKLNSGGNFVWAKSFGSRKDDFGSSITTDSYENVYMNCSFQDTINFNPGKGTYNLFTKGSSDVAISKFDKTGDLIWAKSIGGTNTDAPNDIVVNDSGYVFVIGTFFGTMDMDPGAGTYNVTSNGLFDIFVLKLTSSGNFSWGNKMGDYSYDYGQTITINPLGDLYLSGYYQGTVDFDLGTGVYKISTISNAADIFNSKTYFMCFTTFFCRNNIRFLKYL